MASTEQNKSIVRRFWEEVFNGRKLTLIDELFTTDWVYHGVAGRKLYGPEGLKQFLTEYHNAFPDMQVKVENLIAEGDKVVSHVTSRGTHKGELMGIAPTGKQVTVPVICINRFAGDKIAEDWEIIDLFGMLQQLDVIPSPE
ncbi:MAG: ester cyclase [Pseudomonadota bacterium]